MLIFSLAYFPNHVGGAEVAVKEITDRIDDIEFHLITLHFDSTLPHESREGNVQVHRIGFGAPHAEVENIHVSFLPFENILHPAGCNEGI